MSKMDKVDAKLKGMGVKIPDSDNLTGDQLREFADGDDLREEFVEAFANRGKREQ